MTANISFERDVCYAAATYTPFKLGVKWQKIMSEEKEFILERIEAVKESLHFFSNEMKPERERWVVNKLLDYIKIDRNQDEVKSSTDEPIDVKFQDGCFQVKEILEKDRKRTAEFKEALEIAEKANKVEDLLEPYSPIDLKIEDAIIIVTAQVKKWTKKYPPTVRKNIDLLFYLNLQDIYIQHQGNLPPIENLDFIEQAGWRSVSVVENSCAFVVFASKSAPDFIKRVVGIILE